MRMHACGDPCLIDLEASGIHPESYPVQVAWSLPTGQIECHLIRPAPEWTYWDPNAARLHGISRGVAVERGKPIDWIVERMNTAFDGKTVYSDAVNMDGFWLGCLFDEHGTDERFWLADYLSLFDENEAQKLASCSREAGYPAHRADLDVARLLAIYRCVKVGDKPLGQE